MMEAQELLAILVFIVWGIGVWLFRRDLNKKIEKEQWEIKQYHQYYEDTNSPEKDRVISRLEEREYKDTEREHS